MKSEGFWQWCVIICKIVFLDFVHHLNYRSRSEASLTRGPTDRFCFSLSFSFLFPPEYRSRILLPKRCGFIYNLDDGRSPREEFYSLFPYLCTKCIVGWLTDACLMCNIMLVIPTVNCRWVTACWCPSTEARWTCSLCLRPKAART
jgi:hypothetical protein